MRWVLGGLAALLLAVSASGCVTVSLSEEGIYLPQKGTALTAEALAAARVGGYALEPQTITAADGTKLAGVLLRRPGADRTVLYFGGNMFTVGGDGATIARRLAPLGVNLMMVDLRGYGASGAGELTQAAILSDGLSVFDHLASLPGMEPSQIVVHGMSLGSFLAGHVAAHRQTAGVVLEASATTAEAFVGAAIPRLARPFVRVDIAEGLRGQGNLQHMSRLDEPLLVIVGEKDTLTPPQFSRELFQAATLPPERKRLAVIEGASHDEAIFKPAMITAYREFLALTR